MKFKIIIALMLLVLVSCSKENDMLIAVSKMAGSPGYERYNSWLSKLNPDAELINLYEMEYSEIKEILAKCDGFVLSGGPDVHPGRFGMEKDTARCGIDMRRDTLEFLALEIALERKIPILAICRGEQLLNVHLGGKLIVDLPADLDTEIHRNGEGSGSHEITIFENTLLYELNNGINTIEVNTNHHQAVAYLADELKATAYSTEDKVIEAFQWRNPEGKSFLIATQWHPEKPGADSILNRKIGERFFQEVKKNKMLP